MVLLINFSSDEYTIQPSERIAQMVISEYTQVCLEETDNLDDTERGEGGFGHTGK